MFYVVTTEAYTVYFADRHNKRSKLVALQYWFDRPPIDIKLKPHGNSHTATPFVCTAQSAKKDNEKSQLTLSQQKLFSKLQK